MATSDVLGNFMDLPMADAPILVVQPSAAAEFDRMRTKRNRPDAVLRVRVIVDSGCGDFRYAMGIEPGPREGDQSIPAHGVTVVVDVEERRVAARFDAGIQRLADGRRVQGAQSTRPVRVRLRPVVQPDGPGDHERARSGRAGRTLTLQAGPARS